MAVVDDTKNSVKTVEQIDHKTGDQGGGQAAYTELKKEYDTYAKSHSAEDTKKYWDGVTDTLKKDNVLPDLAVAWGKANVGDIDGKDAADIKLPFKYDFSGASSQYNFDKAMATSLSDNLKSIDTGGGWAFGFNSDGKIQAKELDKYLEKQTETNKKDAEKESAREDQAPLFKGTPPLISVLDGADDKGKQDGKVSTSDMKRYLEDYNRFTNNGATKAPDGSPYTPENAQYVQDILDGNKPGVSSGGTFKVSDLADKGGITDKKITGAGDYDSVVSNFNQLQPADATTTATTTPEAGKAGVVANDKNEVTDVTYDNGKKMHFDYKDGKMSGFTNDAGIQFTSADGGKTFKSATPGQLEITNAKVDADGTFHFTANHKDLKIGTDDKAVADVATTNPVVATTPDAVQTQLINDSKAKAGEGYIKVAARLLGKPDSNDSDPAVYKLYKELQQLNNNKTLHAGDPVLTPETLAKITDKEFKDRMASLEQAAATAAQSQAQSQVLEA